MQVTRLDRLLFPFSYTMKDGADSYGHFHWMRFAPALPHFDMLCNYVLCKAMVTAENNASLHPASAVLV